MDLLRAIARLPLVIVLGLWRLIALILRLLGYVLSRLLGNVTWRAPGWMLGVERGAVAAAGSIRRHPGRSVGSMAGILVLGLAGWFGYQWYQARPHPPEPVAATWSIVPPPISDYVSDTLSVYPLHARFDQSVAPIDRVGKAVGDGVRIDPAIAGTWTWSDDRNIDFQPEADWPVGQKYRVRFDAAKAFAPQVRVPKTEFEFNSAPFTAEVSTSDFYQDPSDATLKKSIVQVHFSHAVDTADFEKRVAVTLFDAKGKPQTRKFIVNYDKKKLNAFVHSEPLAVPADDSRVEVKIDKGVHAARGGEGSESALTGTVPIPGMYSLRVNGVEAMLVDNAKFEPEQVLVLQLSQPVGEREIVRSVNAWLLPTVNPEIKEADRTPEPYNWAGSQVSEKILRAATKLDLEPIASELEYSDAQSFKYRADPGRYVYVQVGKGLKSFGGYVLGQASQEVLAVPDYPRMLRFMADGSLLSLSGQKRVAVVARNVPGLKMEIARVLPDQLQHLVSFNNGSYAKPQLGALSPDQITERFEQKIPFDSQDPSKAHYEGVDLTSYLGKANRRGVFLLRLSGYDPAADQAAVEAAKAKPAEFSATDAGETDDSQPAANDGEGEYEGEGDGESASSGDANYQEFDDERLVVVTDLGLVIKKSMDGQLDVFVQSIGSGTPVEGATIEVLAKNGQSLESRTSGADGQAHFAALDAYTREKTPSLFLVRKGDDLSFLPVNAYDRRLDLSRFDIGGIKNAKDAGQLSAYLFSDRGLYRPGDTFHIGMIVRAADWNKHLVGVPLQADILDARGMVVESRKLRLGEAGFEELAYTTQETSPTGSWTVNLSLVQEGNTTALLGSTSVQIKEFLPDRMKATAHLSSEVVEGWVKPDKLSARISLQNLFGTPAQNRRVEASLTLSPVLPVFRSWPAHAFFDPQRAKEGYSEPLGDGTTDENGIAEFPLDLAKYGTSTYRLLLVAKGYEAEGGRSVAAETMALVSSLDYLIGVKTNDDLAYVKRDDKRVVNFVAIDPQAKSIAVDGLKLVLVERRYVSILTKQDSGVYKYESRMKELPLKEEPFKLAAGGVDYNLATDKPGDYALVVKNARGESLNQVNYSVAGEANLARSLERNAELQMALSKKDYAPGEEVEIAVRAPYAGAGLITIERDKVYAHAWFKAATTGSVQHIRVPEDFEGNGYINVQYVRDPSSDEIFMSPLSYGIVPFSVNRDARRDPLTVSTPAMIKPGETLTMKVKSGAPARVAVFAVDEGILQVARYKLGDPLDFFFRKRMLEVGTSQILDLILPEFAKLAAMAAPGGDADGLLGKHLNPFRKKRAPPIAYWSGIVDVDGEKELKYVVPEDFNGKLRVMAVAVAAGKVGTFEGSTTVRGDFVLSPNVPAMVAPGDVFEVSVGVANNLTGLGGKELPITLKLEPSAQVEADGAPAQELKLGEMREGVVVFRLKAKGEPGAATLKFIASSGDHIARLGADLSVRPAVPYRTEVAIGTLAKGQAEVKPLRGMFDAYAKRDADASYVPLVLAKGLASYLDSFPHKCTEQLLSAAVPAMVFDKHPEFGKVVRGDGSVSTADSFAALLAVMRSRQNDEGGFGLWMATPQSERYVSVYAVQFLLEAKEHGWKVPEDMLTNANRYLSQLSADESDGSLAGLRERAFAIYLLTRQGQVTTNQLAAVRQRLENAHSKTWKDDTAAAYVATTLQLLKEDKEAAKLIVGPEKVLTRTAEEAGWNYNRYYDPLVRDGSTLYLLAKHFPERAKALPAQALQNIVKVLQRGWYNTLSSATTVLALDAYASQVGSLGGDKLSLAELAADGTAKAFGKSEGLVVQGRFSGTASGVRVDNAADLAAWYTVSQSGYDRQLPTAERKEGLEIVRELTDESGKALDKVTLGDEIYVHLKIRSTRADGIGNTAIVDLLPGGFEVVQEIPAAVNADRTEGDAAPATQSTGWHSTVTNPKSTWQPDYADVRDDRVVIYGTATTDVRDFVYRIKATNVGTYVVPPTFGESMYDRTVQAQSRGGGSISVVKP
ncbi:MAG: alpha-2-macroglobulin [Tahibacter sp.]